MKKLASVLVQSRRILIAVLIGIIGAMTLPDLRLRPPPPRYVVEDVKPSHRISMEPLVELWNASADGPAFCGKVKSLPGCWDVSDNFIPGNIITGIVRTKESESLLVTILPPHHPDSAAREEDDYRHLPIILYHVPRSPAAFVINPAGDIRSVEKSFGFRMQSKALERLNDR